jgi:hypothetical protein
MKITIPTTLNEITLKQYQAFKRAILSNQEDDFVKLALVTIFVTLSLEDAIKINIKDFNDSTSIASTTTRTTIYPTF